MRLLLSTAAAFVLAAAAAAPASAPQAVSEDPHLWLEEVEGERAITQVKEWNRATEQLLTKDPRFENYRARALEILNDREQIAQPDAILGDKVFNFWRDANNPRGIWRVSPIADYVAGKPQWRTLIDVDALGKAEGKSWVWHGADCLAPEYRRCLVSLSPGGSDADIVWEFDLQTGVFVDGGFTLPEAKTNVAWVDKDKLVVSTDFSPDSLTTSGYSRIAKLWKRGTPLSEARTLLEAQKRDVEVYTDAYQDGERRWVLLGRGKTHWTTETSLLKDDGSLTKLPVPEDAVVRDVLNGQLIVTLQRDLAVTTGSILAGSVVAYSLTDMEAGRPVVPELVMSPSKSQAIEEVKASKNVLWVKALDDVSGRLFALRRRGNGRWASEAVSLASNSTIHLISASGRSDLAFVMVEGMLTPPALHAVELGKAPVLVQKFPAKFDATAYEVEQRFATSKDGTRVPYFLVRKKGLKGAVPALIHAYGGFSIAQSPTYLTSQPYRSGPLGMFWVEDGNAFVLANIRGGGEYGPEWHRSVLRENRQKSFDDLHAVAEDLVRTGVSAKGKIGISGRSNGGVLVGAAMTQRPDLYGAVISGSPLHDMKRYSHLLAGASWIDEYGDPDKPEDWAFLSKYSPYQNVKPGVKYPPVFFYLSTKDDRVHPGHARKMAARLSEYGNRFHYRENLEGGHSVEADRSEDAIRAAMLMLFLDRELDGKK